MRDIVRVDGLSGTVAALLCCGVRSPCTVACPLRMSDRYASYCRLPTTLISCTYLMPVIRCVWPVTYAFNVPPAPCAWWGHDEPDARRLGNARARPGAESHWAHGGSRALLHQVVCLEHQDTWWYWSPTGWWSWCFGNMVTSEPFRVGGRAWSCEARGDSGALSYWVTGSVPWARGNTGDLSWRVARSVLWGTWRHRSPLLTGGVLCASGHVAEPELSGTGNGSRAVRLIF
jgi:hypothetical protein